MRRLVLTIGTKPFEFTPVGGNEQYPYLVGVGSIRIAARAGAASGFGATDTPNASAVLQNIGKRAALLIGNPLRCKAELYDDDRLIFAGTVSEIAYGLDIELTLES